MTDFKAALKLPFSGWKKMLIGAAFFALMMVVSFIPISGINTLLAMLVAAVPIGYSLSCAKSAAQKRFVLPEWANFTQLFVKGISALAVSIIYSIPVLVLLVVFILLMIGAVGSSAAAFITDVSADPSIIFSMFSGAIVVAIIAVLLLILVSYLTPMAWMKMANEGFGAAFDFRDIFRRAFTAKYFLGVLFAYVLNLLIIIAGMLIAILLIITIIGPLVAYSFAVMISYVVIMTIYGQLYAETSAKAAAKKAAAKAAAPAKKAKAKKR